MINGCNGGRHGGRHGGLAVHMSRSRDPASRGKLVELRRRSIIQGQVTRPRPLTNALQIKTQLCAVPLATQKPQHTNHKGFANDIWHLAKALAQLIQLYDLAIASAIIAMIQNMHTYQHIFADAYNSPTYVERVCLRKAQARRKQQAASRQSKHEEDVQYEYDCTRRQRASAPERHMRKQRAHHISSASAHPRRISIEHSSASMAVAWSCVSRPGRRRVSALALSARPSASAGPLPLRLAPERASRLLASSSQPQLTFGIVLVLACACLVKGNSTRGDERA
jgi:hypothetical protein